MGGWDQRLSRALQFQPGHVGGRVASAQPILRRGGTLRRPSIGSAYAPPEAPTLVDSYAWVQSDVWEGSTSVDLATAWAAWPFAQTEGNTVIVLVVAHQSGTPVAPTGWSVLGAATAGALNYSLAWIKVGASAPAADWSFPSLYGGWALGDGSPGFGSGMIGCYEFGPTPLSPTATIATSTATAGPISLPLSSGTGPGNMYAFADTEEPQGFPNYSDAGAESAVDDSNAFLLQVGAWPAAAASGTVSAEEFSGGWVPDSVDWITAAIGWA